MEEYIEDMLDGYSVDNGKYYTDTAECVHSKLSKLIDGLNEVIAKAELAKNQVSENKIEIPNLTE